MATGTETEPTPATPVPPPVPVAAPRLLDAIKPHALKIAAGASAVGLISTFLPLVSLGFLSVAVVDAWQGVLCLLGYVGVGVLAGLILLKKVPSARPLVLASLITAGVVTLLASWVFLRVLFSELSPGFGAFLNFLAAFVVAAAVVLEAKKEKIL
jgi:hypothetical protein